MNKQPATTQPRQFYWLSANNNKKKKYHWHVLNRISCVKDARGNEQNEKT